LAILSFRKILKKRKNVAARKAFKNHRNKNRERTQRPLGDGKKMAETRADGNKITKISEFKQAFKGQCLLKNKSM